VLNVEAHELEARIGENVTELINARTQGAKIRR
jgi:hypothetical protein